MEHWIWSTFCWSTTIYLVANHSGPLLWTSIYFTLPFVGSSFIHQCAPNLSTAALTTALWLKGVMVSLLQREETKKLKLSPTTSLTLHRAWSLSWVPSNRLQPRRPRHEEAAQPPWKYNELQSKGEATLSPFSSWKWSATVSIQALSVLRGSFIIIG